MERIGLEHGLWMYNDPAFPLGADAVQLAHFASEWVRPGMHVCDAGCGTGAVMFLMAGACPEARFSGVEIRSDAGAMAMLAAVEQNLHICTHCADMRNLRDDPSFAPSIWWCQTRRIFPPMGENFPQTPARALPGQRNA